MWEMILWPIVILGGMGALFGAGLALAARKFAIKLDPRTEAIREALPGANCGGCGFPGCDNLALSITEGRAEANACPVGGAAVAIKIADIMGIKADPGERMVAWVACQGTPDVAKSKFTYQGVMDCTAASALADGPKGCRFGCLGMGNCVRACQFGALSIVDSVAVVDPEKCVSCKKCLQTCPKDIINMIPESRLVRVACRAMEHGKSVKDLCEVGCISCGLCVRACRFDAIKIIDDLPVIDYNKCTNCMSCAQKCPTHAIYAQLDQRKVASVRPDDCIGCGICKTACQFEAIIGERKEKHKIVLDKCTGCGMCEVSCPKQAIDMIS